MILCSTLIYLKDIRPLIPKYTYFASSPHHFILSPDGDKRRFTLANSAICECSGLNTGHINMLVLGLQL